MKKIKIMELYAKISAEEEVPKMIYFDDYNWEYFPAIKDYLRDLENESVHNPYLFGWYLGGTEFKRLKNFLAEIIEEDKEIEKITIRDNSLGFPNGEWTARKIDRAFAVKINELIDEVNKLKKENK